MSRRRNEAGFHTRDAAGPSKSGFPERHPISGPQPLVPKFRKKVPDYTEARRAALLCQRGWNPFASMVTKSGGVMSSVRSIDLRGIASV